MYLVAIAWLYVTLLMGLAEDSILGGIITFTLYGLFPLSIVMYLFGSPARRAKRRAAEAREAARADGGTPDAGTDEAVGPAPADGTPAVRADAPGAMPGAGGEAEADGRGLR